MKVLYGDTDSAFIQCPKDKAEMVVGMINRHIEPYEVEAGEFYKALLFVDAKKRYAGLTEDDELVVKGFEVNKRDYCALARDTQETLLKMVLKGATQQQAVGLVAKITGKILSHDFDELLVITKGVKEIEEYKKRIKKDGTEFRGAPHVRAYKKMLAMGYPKQYDISFVWTTDPDSVQPAINGQPLPTNIDYVKYIRSQFIQPNRSIFKAAFKTDLLVPKEVTDIEAQRKAKKSGQGTLL